MIVSTVYRHFLWLEILFRQCVETNYDLNKKLVNQGETLSIESKACCQHLVIHFDL